MGSWLVWSLALFVVGLVIAVIEVIVPSAGLLALAALGCLIGSLYCAYQISGTVVAIVACVEAVVVPLVIITAFKILPKTSLGKQLILSPPDERDGGKPADPVAKEPPSLSPFDSLRGAQGRVVTALRPSGTVEFDGRRVSVVSNGESIAKDTLVKVVLVEGNRVVVEAAET